MLFDWFTMGAQVLNFVVLVWLMKHFLYQPILNAIDQREKLIAKELSEAAATKADAQKEHNQFLQKNQEHENKRTDLLAEATKAADTEKQRLMAEAKQALADWSLKRQASLMNEAKNFHQAVRQRTQEEIFSIARKTLTDLAGLKLEERMIEVFIQKLHEIPEKEKELLISDARKSKNLMIVRSTFNPLEPQRVLIEKSVKELFGVETEIHFKLSPGLISGIVLIKNDSKIAWCIDDYLGSMQIAVEDLLKEKKSPSTKLETKPKVNAQDNTDERNV